MDVAAYLTKPYDAEFLLDTVAKCLAAKEAEEKVTKEELDRAERVEKVLLVEDDKAAGSYLERAIKAADYSVVRAESGHDGLDKAVLEKPTIIVTKLVLTGMNGDRLAEILNQMPGLGDVPVILYDDSGLGHTGSEYGSRPGIHTFVSGDGAANIVQAIRAAVE